MTIKLTCTSSGFPDQDWGGLCWSFWMCQWNGNPKVGPQFTGTKEDILQLFFRVVMETHHIKDQISWWRTRTFRKFLGPQTPKHGLIIWSIASVDHKLASMSSNPLDLLPFFGRKKKWWSLMFLANFFPFFALHLLYSEWKENWPSPDLVVGGELLFVAAFSVYSLQIRVYTMLLRRMSLKVPEKYEAFWSV